MDEQQATPGDASSGLYSPAAPLAHPSGLTESVRVAQPYGATSSRAAQAEQTESNTVSLAAAAAAAREMTIAQQRLSGTLYGASGYSSIDMTMPVLTNAVENSGSLTGHILAQGWRDELVDRRRANVRVVIAMLVVLGLLVTVSLVFLLTVGDAFSTIFRGASG